MKAYGHLAVECDLGHRSEEAPQRFLLGDRRLEVVQVLDRWIGPDHRYFKVLADDDGIYILRHDIDEGEWQLTLFSRSEALKEPHSTLYFSHGGKHQ